MLAPGTVWFDGRRRAEDERDETILLDTYIHFTQGWVIILDLPWIMNFFY